MSFKQVKTKLCDEFKISRKCEVLDWNSVGLTISLTGLTEDQARAILTVYKEQMEKQSG